MGGKKKTKWRKLPPEELSHITVKRSASERTKCKEQHSRQTEDSYRNKKDEQSDNTVSRNSPSEELAEEQNHEVEAYAPNAEFVESGFRPGFYVNGLWLPVSEMPNQTANITAFPAGVIRQVPLLMQVPSTYAPSCPSYPTFHAPDVPPNAHTFVPPSNHCLYYLTRLHPRTPAESFKEEESTVHSKTTEHYSGNEEESSGHHLYPLPFNDVLTGTIKISNPTNEVYNADFHSLPYHETGDHENSSGAPCEAYEDIIPPYQYPGCSFGQPLYSIPLYPVLPPTFQAQAVPPWPGAHFQRRRRKKRKGYAEYAIIPAKKTTTTTTDNVKNAARQEDKLKEKFPEQTQSEGQHNSTNSSTLQAEEVTGENSKDKQIFKNAAQNINALGQDELLIYTTELVENILLEAKEELGQIDDSEKCATTKAITGTNKNHVALQTGNMSQSLIQKDELQNALTVEEQVGEFSSLLSKNESLAKKEPPKEIKNISLPDITKEMNTTTKTISETYDFDKQIHASSTSTNKSYETKNGIESVNVTNVKDETNINITSNLNGPEAIKKELCANAIKADSSLSSDHPDKSAGNKEFIGTQSSSPQNTHNLYNVAIDDNLSQSEVPLPDSIKTNLFDDADCKNCDPKPKIDEKSIHDAHKDSVRCENEKQPVSSSLSSHCSYMTHMISSETLIRETELELNKLHQLTSKSPLQKQSIYKLAYDENITDQSETEDQELVVELEHDIKQISSQRNQVMPDSASRSEILVHEADSASDAGSEDVELLPHRYESESAQKCNKHIYVNNLSLAVEMLRTRENLPYDDEFKRIVDDDAEQNMQPFRKKSSTQTSNKRNIKGTVNPGFIGDHSNGGRRINFQSRSLETKDDDMLTVSLKGSGASGREWRNSIADSGVQSEDSGDEVGEEAKETSLSDPNADIDVVTHLNPQRRVNSNYRHGAQVRQQFHILAPRTGIVNPCLCCIVM